MVMKKRFTNLGGIIKRSNTTAAEEPASDLDTPEANAARGVRLFCESGAANTGEEVLHLPTIVEAAVASPAAAAAAASQIRKFLSKENYTRPHVQYNAIMIIRILADNPGPSFTKNMDKHFADTVKHLLRNGQDPSVAQILRETLDALDREKAYDTNLSALFAMWKKEKELMAKAAKQFGPRTMIAPPWQGNPQAPSAFGQGGGGGKSNGRGLPPPSELVGRIEEARTSAKLLLQLVQSTPPQELLGNELVKEFSERCMAAQRSIQGYINCDNPPPDDDTMLTLIETNEQLSLAASKHQRAVLQARRLHGPSPSPPIPGANSNSIPMPPTAPRASGEAVPTNSYSPSNSYAPPSQPPSNSYGAVPQPPNNLYAPIPQHPPQPPPRSEVSLLPPIDVASKEKIDLPLPPSLQAGGGNRRRAEPEQDDPFADHHSPTYAAPPGPPPPPPRQVSDSDDAPRSNFGPSTGSPSAYHPSYQSTPSYLGRQESSSNNLTMHGGAPVQRTLSEEEEYARDYPVSAGPRTPEQTRRPHRDSDVSPIADRGTVTYRY